MDGAPRDVVREEIGTERLLDGLGAVGATGGIGFDCAASFDAEAAITGFTDCGGDCGDRIARDALAVSALCLRRKCCQTLPSTGATATRASMNRPFRKHYSKINDICLR